MTLDATGFWHLLETNFPLGGPRGHLRELLGAEAFDALETAGLLQHRGVADRYPCERPGGDGCPRVLIERGDGSYIAICGNDPPECGDLDLGPRDVEVVAVDALDLCEKIRVVLQVRNRAEELPDLRAAYRVGTFIPEPGVKHAVYLLVRCSERDYSEAFAALRTHAAGQTLAVLVPTERFVTEALRHQAMAAGIVVATLVDTVGIDATGLRPLEDPLAMFADIGRIGGAAGLRSPVVARVIMRGGDGRPVWRDLDDAGYQRLREDGATYDIFADELTKTVAKGKGSDRSTATKVIPSYFRLARAAIEKRANYDPGTGEDDGEAAKQTFQRARKVFDIGSGQSWALFKTDKVDNHAVYRFDPDPSVTFAYVFSPDT